MTSVIIQHMLNPSSIKWSNETTIKQWQFKPSNHRASFEQGCWVTHLNSVSLPWPRVPLFNDIWRLLVDRRGGHHSKPLNSSRRPSSIPVFVCCTEWVSSNVRWRLLLTVTTVLLILPISVFWFDDFMVWGCFFKLLKSIKIIIFIKMAVFHCNVIIRPEPN